MEPDELGGLMPLPLFELLQNRDVVFVILMVGIWTGAFAMTIPGTGLLELISVFCLLVAAVASLTLPLNLWALMLLGLGAVAFVAELWHPLRGLLLLGAVILFSLGSVLLFRGPQNAITGVSWPLAAGGSAVSLGFFWFVVQRTMLVHRKPPDLDLARLIGQQGLTVTDVDGHGSVQVASEQWSARSEAHLTAGTKVEVVAREGFTLLVRAVEAEERGGAQH
ncbi:MAG: NfeD family protein [Anaerolineales bacterium]|jgi:membrane-bound serine protease (ClpP class)